ncbi:MAG: LptA/OstA family protein [Pelosinus sp.]|nr:LptA/OstA family protein [Pelosinus sp.]
MKKTLFFCLSLLILISNISFAAMPTITADKQYFDISAGMHVLSGHVYIAHNNRVVTAGEAKTNMVEVWASGGVTFVQDDINFSGDSLYVYFPSSSAQISGNVKLSRTNLEISANKADFNWDSKIAVFSGNVNVVQNGNCWSADSVHYNVLENSIY